jgi:hypothetical protein
MSEKLVPTFADREVPCGQRNGSLRPYSRLSGPEPLLFLPSSSSIVLTRLSGPCSRLTTAQKIWQRRESNSDLWISSQELPISNLNYINLRSSVTWGHTTNSWFPLWQQLLTIWGWSLRLGSIVNVIEVANTSKSIQMIINTVTERNTFMRTLGYTAASSEGLQRNAKKEFVCATRLHLALVALPNLKINIFTSPHLSCYGQTTLCNI